MYALQRETCSSQVTSSYLCHWMSVGPKFSMAGGRLGVVNGKANLSSSSDVDCTLYKVKIETLCTARVTQHWGGSCNLVEVEKQ
jgi:hypothetical protein